MKAQIGWAGLLLAGVLVFSGCAAVLIGAGAVGGYAVSRDSVVVNLEKSKEAVYRQSLEVAKKAGQVTVEDPRHGIIEMTTPEAVKVRIRLKQLTPRALELKVKARKNMLPRVDVAQDLYGKIMERL